MAANIIMIVMLAIPLFGLLLMDKKSLEEYKKYKSQK
jgi:Na+/alanine symporter